MILRTYYGCDFTFESLNTEYKEMFIIWPRHCILSGRLLWFENVIRVTRHIVGNRERMYVDRFEMNKILLMQ